MERVEKPKIARALVLLTALFFATLHSPEALSAEPALDNESLLAVLNQDRQSFGLGPLAADPKLERAALAKAADILQNSYFAHTAPSGLAPWDFIKNTGFQYSAAGENLALNYNNPFELQRDFMDSPRHRDNLLSPTFEKVGIAVLGGQFRGKPAVITVQMFAAPQ